MLSLGKRNCRKIVHLTINFAAVRFEFTCIILGNVRYLVAVRGAIDVIFVPPYNEKNQLFGRIQRVPLDLKFTINLPKTSFPMKANLPQNEPKLLERWEQMRMYERIREARKGAPCYLLHD